MGFSFEQFKAMNRLNENENLYKKALQEIAKYGEVNTGMGFTCSKIAKKALEGIKENG